jgi:hypothetical protein
MMHGGFNKLLLRRDAIQQGKLRRRLERQRAPRADRRPLIRQPVNPLDR